MANTLFIKFTSLPVNTGDNISFKYNGNATTVTILFGSGAGKCPIGTTVAQQASNLATFISTTYPTTLIAPPTTTDTLLVSAINGSNITSPLQPNLSPTTPEVLYQYVTTNDGSPRGGPNNINSTSPAFPTTLGSGTQIKMDCYWRYYGRSYKVGWNSGCSDDGRANSPATMAQTTFNLTRDYSISDAFTNMVFPNTAFLAFANVAFQQYSIDTATSKFKFRMNGENAKRDSCSETPVQQEVRIRITRKAPGGTFTQLTLTGDDFRSGDAVQVSLNTPEKVALFLSTDFLDLGGINNQVAYDNPIFMNYDDNSTTPSINNNTVALICKSALSGNNPINSYEYGYGSDLSWTWWNKSFLVRDSESSDTVYANLLYLVNQQVSTGTVEPGTKAINS